MFNPKKRRESAQDNWNRLAEAENDIYNLFLSVTSLCFNEASPLSYEELEQAKNDVRSQVKLF